MLVHIKYFRKSKSISYWPISRPQSGDKIHSRDFEWDRNKKISHNKRIEKKTFQWKRTEKIELAKKKKYFNNDHKGRMKDSSNGGNNKMNEKKEEYPKILEKVSPVAVYASILKNMNAANGMEWQ